MSDNQKLPLLLRYQQFNTKEYVVKVIVKRHYAIYRQRFRLDYVNTRCVEKNVANR